MLAWSPLLVQTIEIHALGFVLRKLQLNRHREAEVAPHRHDWEQLILYLSGEGTQQVGGRRRAARTGDLFVIPRGVSHGFTLRGHSRPVCLVLDYDLVGATRSRRRHRRVPMETLNELHASLAGVPAKGRLNLSDYSAILAVTAKLLEHPARPAPTLPRPGLFQRVRALVSEPVSLAQAARTAGYHPDHLTRKLKRETGLGLRAWRDRMRLAAAQRALRTAATVAEAATQCGFEDPNYFTRWYRRQTGQSPTRWRG